jgi:hypothetical protein
VRDLPLPRTEALHRANHRGNFEKARLAQVLGGAAHVTVTTARDLLLTPKPYIESTRHETAKWDAAEAAAERRAAQARATAEGEIAAEPRVVEPEPAADSGAGRGLARVVHARCVRYDGYERDDHQGAVRRLARDHLFVAARHGRDRAPGARA